MSLDKRYKLQIWNRHLDWQGDVIGSFDDLSEAREAFNDRTVKPGCDWAAVYDTHNTNKALWTFPAYWDGHDHRQGQGFEPSLWRAGTSEFSKVE